MSTITVTVTVKEHYDLESVHLKKHQIVLMKSQMIIDAISTTVGMESPGLERPQKLPFIEPWRPFGQMK